MPVRALHVSVYHQGSHCGCVFKGQAQGPHDTGREFFQLQALCSDFSHFSSVFEGPKPRIQGWSKWGHLFWFEQASEPLPSKIVPA